MRHCGIYRIFFFILVFAEFIDTDQFIGSLDKSNVHFLVIFDPINLISCRANPPRLPIARLLRVSFQIFADSLSKPSKFVAGFPLIDTRSRNIYGHFFLELILDMITFILLLTRFRNFFKSISAYFSVTKNMVLLTFWK